MKGEGLLFGVRSKGKDSYLRGRENIPPWRGYVIGGVSSRLIFPIVPVLSLTFPHLFLRKITLNLTVVTKDIIKFLKCCLGSDWLYLRVASAWRDVMSSYLNYFTKDISWVKSFNTEIFQILLFAFLKVILLVLRSL